MAQGSGSLHEDPDVLGPEVIDQHRAIVSIMEELEAADWYDQRVQACDDPDLREILAHNRDEESFTFRLLSPQAAAPLAYAGGTRARPFAPGGSLRRRRTFHDIVRPDLLGRRFPMARPSPLLGMKPRIRHAMLPVKDLDRSVDFYQGLLGMTVMRRRRNDVKQLDAVYVGYGEEDRDPCLELIQDISAKAPAAMPAWTGHIALAVSNLAMVCAFLEQAGVEIVTPCQPIAPGRKDLIAMVVDPDGYQIELHEKAGAP